MEGQVGRRRVRREDPVHLTGEAQFTDDKSPSGTVHAAVVRSRYGHARIESIDTSEAARLEGVLDVYTAGDIQASEAPGYFHVSGSLAGSTENDIPLLAADRVRYEGEPVALVVAEDRYRAQDAVEAVTVDYTRLDAVTGTAAAIQDDAPSVHDHAPDNIALDWSFGDEADTEAAFERADTTVSLEVHNQRLVPNAMEPRAALAEYEGDDDSLTVTLSTQVPHGARGNLAEALGLSEDRLRVVAPAVGGGFGSKGGSPYSEDSLAAWAALQLQRPVKWTATRTESHLADHHGRGFHLEGEMALTDEGSMLGLRMQGRADLGAYMVWGRTVAANLKTLVSGQYDVPHVYGQVLAVYTNTVPTGPYRGAGRPEAVFILERLVRRAAQALDMDPVALRRRNLIPPDAFPYETATGMRYDSGRYEAAMDRALELADYQAVREGQADQRDGGTYRGVGVASFVENTGTGPGTGETALLRFDDDGHLRAYSGTADHGQGHETTFAQLLADRLGLPYDDIDVVEGDTEDLSQGTGTFGSRSAAVGGSALVECAERVLEQARLLAADTLEAAEADVVFDSGSFHIRGSPERAVSLQALAERAVAADELPAGVSPGLEATEEYVPDNYAFAFGTHVAVVAVEPSTGEVALERFAAVDDVGTQLNPSIVEGQVHGGVVQGLGQALREEAVYDTTGSLLTASFQDYAMPRADDVPEIATDETVTPSPHTPMGAKGVGEGGTMGAPPAVVNAVVDALSPLGIAHIETPLTAERVWQSIRAARD